MLNNCHNHYANINGHNMNQNIHLNNEKKYRSYKLINDPFLKKGANRQYRYDGVVSSKESPIQTIDPRPRVPLLWNMIKEPINLATTRFKIDKNYVGQPPSIEVSITNLNDNINKTFLQDTLKKFDAIEETEIFYHPKTSKHLGLAKVVFMTPSGAKACVSKLNRTSLMGNIINVFFDPFAKKINQIYDTIVNPSSGSNVANDYDNNFIDPNNLDQQTLSRISEFGYDISNNEFGSSFATPTTFENQPTSKQYYDEAQAWKSNSTNSEYDKSPVRESLQTRINNFIRFHNPSKFQNDSNQESSFSLPDLLNSNESPFYKKRVQKNIDDSDAILDTPPSPFLSASDYLKWNQFTKEMDGHNADQINVDDIHNNNNNENNRKYCRNSETSHVDDDDNDSRMSLSSLSSGGKFEEHLGSNNAVYDHLSLIPGLANWNADNGRAAYSNSLFPHYMYQSFVQTNSQPFGHFSGFTSSMLRQLNGSMEKEEEDDHEEEKNFSGDKNKPYRSSKDLMEDLSADISRESTKELKEILRKDICKKIVESFSFKLFDQWWEESEKKTNDNVLPNLDGVANDQSSRTEINIPFFNHPNFERSIQNIQSTLTPSFEYGVSRGLRAAMGKMPSFKKKKPKSPNRVIDDKLSDISDEDIDREKYLQLHRRRRRRRPPPHSRSDRSVSSDSRHRSLSSSSSSTSSSLSSQSHSDPSSSSAGNSSESSSSSVDDYSDYSAVSNSEEGSGSELDSDASSTSSYKSSLSSLVSKKSVSSSKSFTGPLTAINDLPNDTEQKSSQNIFDSDTSSTYTADETIEELKKFNNKTSSINDGLFDESINDMHLKEFEASHALISLAHSICPNETDAFDSEQSLNNRLTIDGTDLVHNDHDYCRPPQSQLSSTSETKETPTFIPNKVKNVDNKQRKRKVNTKKSSVLLAPDVNGFLPVASELRKAKYKALGFKTNDDNFDLDRQINNENQAPLIQVITPIKFKARDQKTEEEIVFEFQKNGIDLEDIGYLKRRYKQLLQEENNTSDLSWINDVHWVDHPATYLPTPLPRKRRKLDDPLSREHKTGCARSEGYYKLDRMEKMKHFANAPISCIGMEDDNLPVARQIATTQQMTRDARINQRRLQMMVEQHYNITTDFLKMNKLEFRTKKVKFARSKIHHWGLFAMEKIRPDEMVIEYIGQQIRPMMADWREKRYGAGSSYFFKIDSDTIIDATNSGNVARFINHSCSPNCYAKVITVQGQKRIVIYSKQTIEVGQEITYDYKFPIENDKIPCLCRTPGCRGFLN